FLENSRETPRCYTDRFLECSLNRLRRTGLVEPGCHPQWRRGCQPAVGSGQPPSLGADFPRKRPEWPVAEQRAVSLAGKRLEFEAGHPFWCPKRRVYGASNPLRSEEHTSELQSRE